MYYIEIQKQKHVIHIRSDELIYLIMDMCKIS